MDITKGSQFNPSKSLEGCECRILLLIAHAMPSTLVIGLTFTSTAYRLPPWSWLNVVTMVASVLILAVSLMQYSSSDAVNAEH